MVLTLKDLSDRLEQIEETQLLELLQLTSSDLVNRFQDIIEDNADYLESEIEQLWLTDEERDEDDQEEEFKCDDVEA